MPTEIPVGKISHYFNKIGVAVVEVSAEIKIGDKIAIVSKDGKRFEQAVDSMQIENTKIAVAKPGQSIGMKVTQPVREGMQVFKIVG